ncbi:MAG TPA: hypothetical protein VGH89_07070 [Pseudonocardia sp.]|jgi:hypothetical protein
MTIRSRHTPTQPRLLVAAPEVGTQRVVPAPLANTAASVCWAKWNVAASRAHSTHQAR